MPINITDQKYLRTACNDALTVNLSAIICPSTYPRPTDPTVCLSACLSVCLAVCLSVCSFVPVSSFHVPSSVLANTSMLNLSGARQHAHFRTPELPLFTSRPVEAGRRGIGTEGPSSVPPLGPSMKPVVSRLWSFVCPIYTTRHATKLVARVGFGQRSMLFCDREQ